MNAEKMMRDIIAAFTQSDLRPLLAALDDHVMWKSAQSGAYRGRLGAVEALSNLSRDFTFQRMAPKDVTAMDDIVWGVFETVVHHNRGAEGGKPMQFDMAVRWRLKDGKIVEHQAFYHTGTLLEVLAF